jgi:hypothetical protein
MKRLFIAASLAGLALAGLPVVASADDPTPPRATTPIEDPIPGHIRQGPLRTQLQVKASGSGLTAPLYGTFAPGPGTAPGETTTQPNILYVVDEDGPLWAVDTRTGAKRLFIDTSRQRPMVPVGAFGPGTYDERGFLGVAFHPDYQVPGAPGFGKFYTLTTELLPEGTNADTPPADHTNVLTEWQAADPLTPPPVRPASREGDGDTPPPEQNDAPLAVPIREVVKIGWPQFNHDGGAIFFGTRPADRRLLYLTTGDGGSADDQNLQIGFRGVPAYGHGTGSEATAPNRAGNGQTPTVAWGKVFRFDPFALSEVTVPAGDDVPNPLTPFMIATGLRNPWRASSDRADLGGSGDVWLADVGQNNLEEVDHLPEADNSRTTLCPTQHGTQGLPVNFGWHWKEGTFGFNPFLYELPGPASDGFVYADLKCESPDRDPMGQYDHDEGTAVIGGFVYRGPDPELDALRGRYVFGDYSRRFHGVGNGDGEVFVLDEDDACDPEDCTPRVKYLVNGALPGNTFMLGFGEDAHGNIWALANETGIPFKETGLVMKLVRRCADKDFENGDLERRSPECRD